MCHVGVGPRCLWEVTILFTKNTGGASYHRGKGDNIFSAVSSFWSEDDDALPQQWLLFPVEQIQERSLVKHILRNNNCPSVH